VTEQRVRERVVIERVGRANDASSEGAIDGVQRVVLVDTGNLGRDRKRECHLEQCADRQQSVRGVGETREAPTDHVAYADRHTQIHDRSRLAT
jgi:hypothetical protein